MNDEWDQFLEQPDVHAVVDLGAAPGGWSQVVADKLAWGVASSRVLGGAGDGEEVVGGEEGVVGVVGDDWKPRKKKKGMGGDKAIAEPLGHFDPLNIDDIDDTLGRVRGRGTIIAVDLLPIEPIYGVQTIQADFMLDATTRRIRELLCNPENPRGKADVILSDMAANVSGNVAHDIEASLEICEAVFEFASRNLRSAQSVGRRKGGVLL
jgi:23S rRNA (uridine2552-2'-O)-methyltransferase